ncbi:asparagine synthase (glutamine-hydrolyzing) [bacterium]|nr:asparagine synthase (glutamine-hydrolyzing) [bacterium]
MCGIAGIYRFDGRAVLPHELQRMAQAIRHRGPDDEGSYRDGPVGLAFRRLSIIDLSPLGHQPMTNHDGSLWIIFNGEVYNYIELRDELRSKGYSFRSQSDTEVVLSAYEEWGADCLSRFNGMWGMAIWDAKKRELFCARDRFGVKPFYYYRNQNHFTFASEIKSILQDPSIPREPEDEVVYNFLFEFKRDFSHQTFFKNIFQLEPGHYLKISNNNFAIRRYFDIDLEAETELADDQTYAKQFYSLFEDSIRLRLRSDVPVGSCLSGGQDSSAIVCVLNHLMLKDGIDKSMIGNRQKTFSAYSDMKEIDESIYAEKVIEQTKAEKNTVLPTARQLAYELDKVVWAHEEPFGSTSIYAQYCVMRLAHERGIKVLLDGQGSDELLGGYNQSLFPYLSSMIRRLEWRRFLKEIDTIETNGQKLSRGAKITAALGALPSKQASFLRNYLLLNLENGIHREFVSTMKGTHGIVSTTSSSLRHNSYHDFRLILRSLLMFEDKNSMAFSIEARVPFLDYRLVQFVFSLPDHQKIHTGGARKYVLRNAMQGIVPDMILQRRDKIGFATAEKNWFKEGPLRDKMMEVFYSKSFEQRGYFDYAIIRKKFKALPQSGPEKGYINFWGCFHLEMWLRKFIDGRL